MVITRVDGAAPRSVRRRGWVLLWLGVAALLLSGLSTMVVFLMSYGAPGPDGPPDPPGWLVPLFWGGFALGAAGVVGLAVGGTVLTRAAARDARAADLRAAPAPPWQRVTDPDGTVWFRSGATWWPGRSADNRQVFDGVRWQPVRAVRAHRAFWVGAVLVAWFAPMVWPFLVRPAGGSGVAGDGWWPTWAGSAVALAVAAAALSFVLPRMHPPLGPARGRRWAWTAAPGWPAPPDGFVPDLGWRPDDAWPDPPAHWRGWSLEPTDPAGAGR